jgi:Dolichyl-phosphate-mannose-protein mannosyltransferase
MLRSERPAQPKAAPAGTPPGTPADEPAGGGRVRSWRGRTAALLRQHWLLAVLLAAGVVLRALAQAAYQPALIYVDTLKYLFGAYPGSEPLGYTAVLKVVLLAGGLGIVTIIQHLLGLAMAITLYALLLRRGVNRWLAAVAAAPVLLDAYQVQMEQTIMPDVWFEAMILAGIAVLLWRAAVTLRLAVAAGLILGLSAAVKQVGIVLVVPAVIYVLAVGGGLRRAVGAAAALAATFAVVIVGYCGFSYARTGHFWLAHRQPDSGRLLAAADCATLKVSPAAHRLCPTPAQQAFGPDWLEHSGHSPLYRNPIPPGANRGRLISELTSAVVTQQPQRVAVAILRDSVRLFAVTRGPQQGVTPISRWQFQTTYPTYPPWVRLGPGNTIVVGIQHRVFKPFHFHPINPAYGRKAQVNRPLAAFLRGYQISVGYTPGPLLALFTLAGLAGSVLLLARRAGAATARRQALGCLLFTATAVVILLVPDIYEFSWRYQLPAVVLLPAAGMLGVSALARRRWERGSGAAQPPAPDQQAEA